MRIMQLTWQGEFALDSKNGVRARRSRIVATFAVIIGGILAGSGAITLVGAADAVGFAWPAVGAGLLVFGIWMFRSGVDVTLGRGSIRVRRRGLFSDQTFEDPMSDYKGVVQITTRYRRLGVHWGAGSPSPAIEDVIVQRIELAHPARGWTVPLFQSLSEHFPRAKWENYAKRFKLPLLIQDGGRLIERAPEDLDKTLKELARDGKLAGPTTTGPPPWSFVVNSTNDMIDIAIRRPAVGWGWFALGCIPPAAILYAVFHAGNEVGLLRTLAVFSALMGPVVYVGFIRRHVLVYRDRIEWMLRFPFFKSRGTDAITLKEIEEVSVRKIAGDRKMSLLLSGNRRSLDIARGVRAGHLEWLRDLITNAIVTA